jgi:hypothetical protein
MKEMLQNTALITASLFKYDHTGLLSQQVFNMHIIASLQFVSACHPCVYRLTVPQGLLEFPDCTRVRW